MSQFEKIKIEVDESAYQSELATFKGKILFYQNAIDLTKKTVPDIVFNENDLVSFLDNTKAFLVEKIVSEPMTVGGLELDKNKVFDLLSNAEDLKSIISYVEQNKGLTYLNITKDFFINKSGVVELKKSIRKELNDKHSIFLHSQRQKNIYDSVNAIKTELEKIKNQSGLNAQKVWDDFMNINHHGDLLGIKTKAILKYN